MAALLALLSAGSSRAQRPASVLASSTDPVQSTSPQDWAQRILSTCQSEERRWEESRAALEAELKITAQSEEQLAFAQLELRARRKRLEEQRHAYFARLEYLHLGEKAKSLEPAAERYRRAAGLARPKAKNAFRRTLALLFDQAAPCNLDALESTLFFAIFDLPFTPEQFEPGLGIERVHVELERAYRERRSKSGSLEEAYSGLRPPDPEKAFAYVDELIARLAMMGALGGVQAPSPTPTAQRNVGQKPESTPQALEAPTSGSPEHRSPEGSAELQALLQQLQRYFRLTAEPIRIQVYLHAKVEELEGALRTSIADRTTEQLFDRAEEALFHDEQAMRDLAGAAPRQVLATLQQVPDRWFRQEAFLAVRRALYEDPFSAYWFFVQSGMVAQRPLAFKGSRVRVDSTTPDLESLKGLSLQEVVSRLRQERIPPEFVASHAVLEKTLAEVTLGRDDALRRIDAADLNNKDRAKLRRYVSSTGETDVLSTADVYSWVLRDASKIHGALDSHLVRAALHVLDQAKAERLQQEISATLDSFRVTERARLAGYLRTLADLMLEIDLRQARDSRFQEVTHGGVTGWILRHFLLGTGVPVQLRTPGGVTGQEFAELLDEVGPKNKRSGNLYRGKPTNEIRFIHEGREFHEALVEAINSAQSFLNLTSLDWKLDQGGKEIAYRIMAKKLGFEARSYEAFLETFREGLPLYPGAAPTRIYDIPPSRVKNVLFYFFFKSTDLSAVVGLRRQLERVLDGELACPSVANCGDLSRLRAQAGDKYAPQRASERGYQELWEIYRKLQALFEENDIELRAVTPRMSLAEYVADRERLQRFMRRYGRRRADDPTQPFAVNIIVDSKQDLFNLRWHRPNERYPYFFSDPIWDVYVPLYDFDVHLMQWKGVIEFPWHIGRLPWGGRKIFSVIPFPYVPYPWLSSVPGFGWAGIGWSLLLQHMLATDPRTWYAMVMHTKSVSSESMAIETGMGFGTKYFNPYVGFATWHDMGVKVRGPVAGDVTDHFVQMFNEARVNNTGVPRSRGVKIPKLRYEDYRYAGEGNASGYRSWVVTTHPEKGDSNYRGVFMAALAAARKNIYIENPFFTDPLVAHMLVHKAQEFSARVNCAGLDDFECAQKRREAVKIFLVLPDSTDLPLLDVVGHADLHEMLHHGVKIYRWSPRQGWSATKMLHTKAWLIDYEEDQPTLAYSGSANATQRSHLTDNEMGIISTSPDFAREVYERLFRRDLTTDSQLLSTENLHTAWSTKPVARTARWMRKVLVSLFWVF